MNVHKLKSLEPEFTDIMSGKRNFEIRPDDNFQVGDMLLICQFTNMGYTGLDVQKTVTNVIRNMEGVKDGYVVMTLEDYDHGVDTTAVPTKVMREGFDFLTRDMFGDCPHCGKHILRTKSPERCSECNNPIIWGENKFFKA